MAVFSTQQWCEMGAHLGWDSCEHSETTWPDSPVQVPRVRVDDHQDLPVRTHVPTGGGITKYAGLICWVREGRRKKVDHWFVGQTICAAAIVMLTIFAIASLFAAAPWEDPPPVVPVVERHTPSDLDKGHNPPSFDRGKQGPPGPIGATK